MENDHSRFVTKPGEMKKFNSIEEARAWKEQQLARVPPPTTPKKPRKPKTS